MGPIDTKSMRLNCEKIQHLAVVSKGPGGNRKNVCVDVLIEYKQIVSK